MNFLNFNKKNDVLDNLADAVFVLNYERKIVFANKAMQVLVGYSAKELENMSINELSKEGSEVIYDAMMNNRKNTMKVKTRANKELILEITASDVEDKQQVMVSGRDVTETHTIISNVIAEYKANQEKIAKKTAFVVDVAGEFEKPMNSIIGFSQAMTEGVTGELDEKQKKYLGVISKNALFLNDTLNAVVEITRLDAGKIIANKKLFDITNVFSLVSKALESAFEKNGIDFSIKYDLEKRKIFTDENLLRKVLMIILENALKYTPKGSVQIVISHPDVNYARLQGMFIGPKEVDSSYLMIKTKDTGVGIKEEDLNLIFDEYSIVNKTRKINTDELSTGLHLAIAKKIIDILGGIIWVESEVNQGASFNLIIPIKPPVAASQAETEEIVNE